MLHLRNLFTGLKITITTLHLHNLSFASNNNFISTLHLHNL